MLDPISTRQTLTEWGGIFVGKLKSYLSKEKFRARPTNGTIDSIRHRVKKVKGQDGLELQFLADGKNGYAIPDTINRGQIGRLGKKWPYTPIKKWIEDKGIQIRTKGGGLSTSSDKKALNRAAAAISRSIAEKRGTIERFGYKGTNMYHNLFSPERRSLKRAITLAFEKDAIRYLNLERNKKK